MTFKAYVRKSGSSLVVTIPNEEVTAKRLKEGDLVGCMVDKVKKEAENGNNKG